MHSRLLAFGITALTFIVQPRAQASERPLFGPHTFGMAAGKPAVVAAPFAIDAAQRCDGKATFLLTVENAGISSAVVSLNGRAIFRESDFNATVRTVEKPVPLEDNNTLSVEINGGAAGGALTVSLRRIIEEPAGAVASYTLSAKRQTFSETFAIGDPASAFTLVLHNADAAGGQRVKGGSVRLNGVEVVAEKDFAGTFDTIRRSVVLQSTNTITYELSGDLGDRLSAAVRRLLDENACGPKVFFDTPADHATVASSSLFVTGTVVGTRDVGITVNGAVAEIELTKGGTATDPFRWYAEVPAQPGAVTLEAMAKNAAGATGKATRNVRFAPPAHPLTLTALPASGLVPLSVRLQAWSSAPERAVRYEIDLDGDGSYETAAETGSFTYTTPGIHPITARVTYADGSVATTQTAVLGQSFSVMNGLLKQQWARFTETMATGNVAATLTYFAGGPTREKYKEVLERIRPSLARMTTEIRGFAPLWIRGDVAHYLLTREENGKLVGFHVYFARDSSGIWRIVQL